MPHNGKMWGFSDPAVTGSANAPFNPAFVSMIAQHRQVRTQAFETYRQSQDPNDRFLNGYVRTLLG